MTTEGSKKRTSAAKAVMYRLFTARLKPGASLRFAFSFNLFSVVLEAAVCPERVITGAIHGFFRVPERESFAACCVALGRST